MKSKLPSSKGKKMTLEEAQELARRDKRRLLLMGGATIVLAGLYAFSQMNENKSDLDESLDLPGQVVQVPSEPAIETIAFDQQEVLATIRDETAEQRIHVSDDALTALLYYTKLLTWRNYEALGVEDLDAQGCEELAANPDAARVKPLRLRGQVLALSTRQREGVKFEETYGTLALDGGGHAHFAFTTAPDSPATVGEHLMVEGVFVQMLSADTPGGFVDAPLIASRSVTHSTPLTTLLDEQALRLSLYEGVADDEIQNVSGLPREHLDQLLLRAQELSETEDWDNASELNNEQLNGILQGGEAFRGIPFRIPVSRNLGAWTERAEENGLRLDTMTHGWIGNFNWSGATGVIQWVGPFDQPELAQRYGEARLVSAKGYFFKNVYYQKQDSSPHRAPFFVMSEVTPFIPVPDPTASYILFGVLGMTLLIVSLVFFLLKRDKAAAEQLRQDFVRRRKARNERRQVRAEST